MRDLDPERYGQPIEPDDSRVEPREWDEALPGWMRRDDTDDAIVDRLVDAPDSTWGAVLADFDDEPTTGDTPGRRRGRPPGSVTAFPQTLDILSRTYWEKRDAIGRYLDMAEYAELNSAALRTVQDRVREWGIDWPPPRPSE